MYYTTHIQKYMATLSIRIEEEVKTKAQKTLDSLGLDLSSAVNMFLRQVVVEQALPFTPARTPKAVREAWDKEVKVALKSGKRYSDVDQMFRDILK
jgi:DNA-damage-inducible protein J